MATQFRAGSTGEWVATRWNGGRDRGVCVDFGARHERAFEVFEAVRSGETVVDEAGRQVDFEAEAAAAVWTFGEYGGTFESGSGDGATFAGF